MNKYLEKLAETAKKEDKKTSKAGVAAGVAATAVGADIVNRQRLKGNLTGRERLEHTTSKSAAKAIKEQGLKTSGKVSTVGATQFASDQALGLNTDLRSLLEKNKNLAFASRPGQSRVSQAVWRMNGHGISLAKDKKLGKTVKIDAPTWRKSKSTGINKVKNPETRMTFKNVENLGVSEKDMARSKRILYGVLEKGVHTNKGDIPAKWVRGSDSYKKLSLKEMASYLKNNKSRAAKGYGKAAAGVGVAAVGAALAKKSLEKKAEDVKRVPLTVDVYRYGQRKKTYNADKYLTQIKPKQEAIEGASKAGLVGAGSGLALGAMGKKGIKARALGSLKFGLTAGTVNSALTGGTTYLQSKKRGQEQYRHLVSASKRQQK